MRIQGPEIPALEREVAQVRVLSPGLQENTPVRSLCTIDVRLVAPSSIPTQSFSSLSGTLEDPSGAPLSGAKVTMTHTGSGMVIATLSNSAGIYSFPILQPGTYRLSAEMSGFRTKTTPEIPVGSGAQIRINLKMDR